MQRSGVNTPTTSNAGSEPETIVARRTGGGYAHELIEVTECVAAGKAQSDVMPLADTVAVQDVMAEWSASWGCGSRRGLRRSERAHDRRDRRFRRLVLPDPDDLPAVVGETAVGGAVALDVGRELGRPPLPVVPRRRPVPRALVPEAAVDEHHHARAGEHDVAAGAQADEPAGGPPGSGSPWRAAGCGWPARGRCRGSAGATCHAARARSPAPDGSRAESVTRRCAPVGRRRADAPIARRRAELRGRQVEHLAGRPRRLR